MHEFIKKKMLIHHLQRMTGNQLIILKTDKEKEPSIYPVFPL